MGKHRIHVQVTARDHPLHPSLGGASCAGEQTSIGDDVARVDQAVQRLGVVFDLAARARTDFYSWS